MNKDKIEELDILLNILNKLCGEFEPREEEMIKQLALDRALQITREEIGSW